MTLPDALRKTRHQAGLSQAALARAAGISDGYVAMLEMGTRSNPSPRVVQALASALGVKAQVLLPDKP